MAVPDYLSKLTRSHPNLLLKLIAPAVRQKNTPDLPAPNHYSAGLTPPLGMPFSHQRVSNWVWGWLIFLCLDTYRRVCCGVWHYSSFKCRILDCHTDSYFLVPQSKTASNQSKGRLLVMSLLPDKTRFKSHKVRSIETVQNLQITCIFFLLLTWSYSQFWLLSQNSVKSTFKHTEHGATRVSFD